MITLFFKKHFLINRNLILRETRMMHSFMLLLDKLGNTRTKWTVDEISQLKSHMKHLALSVTVIIIFALPFGLLLFPLYAELLERREKRRINT